MSKIGIITFHRAHNYGAVLQAYALQKAIKKLGYNVGFVDKQNVNIRNAYRLYPRLSISKLSIELRKLAHLILDYKRKKSRYHAFEYFISKNLNLFEVNNVKGDFDTLVLGSDQIWNFEYTSGFDDLYFGVDSCFNSSKIVSYAASMGHSKLTDELNKQLKNNLLRLNAIGVREDSLKEYIESNLSLDSEVNLDPTLLLEKDDWLEICDDEIEKEPYLLVYEVQENALTSSVVKFISKQLGLKVITLCARTDFRTPKDHISNASPYEYVSLFRNAAYVVTTSFHGTVFSIINNVPFTTIGFNNEIDIRSKSILSKLGVLDRMISQENEISGISFDMDFNKVNEDLLLLKEKSIGYLKNAIEK